MHRTPERPTQAHKRSRKRLFFVLAFLLLIAVIFGLTRPGGGGQDKGGKGEKQGTAKHPVPVTIATASQSNVPIQLQAIGNVQSISAVAVKPQVNGPVLSIGFKEGQMVTQGQELFQIDPRPYLAVLNQSLAAVARDRAQIQEAQDLVVRDRTTVQQAQANLKRDMAQLTYAQGEEKRYQGLLNQEFVSREQFEQIHSTVQSNLGTIQADKAAIGTAKATYIADISAVKSIQETMQGDQAAAEANRLNVQFCSVKAPFTGRASSYLVHVGDAVQTNTTSMVTLYKLNPTFVSFAVPEQQLPTIKQQQAKGQLQVVAQPDDGTTKNTAKYHGQVTFFDSTVDTTTGTVLLKGSFENPKGALWPGQFVTVILSLGELNNATVVPSQAVLSGQKGDYVFVAQNNVVQLRNVVVAQTTNNLSAVSQGLQPGEMVVTDGQLLLEPGFHIKVKQQHEHSRA